MGCVYYISRRARWSQEEGPAITESEWRSCVEGDDDLDCGGEGVCDLVSWQDQTDLFRYDNGNIVAESSSKEVLRKMLALATRLKARVMDQEGTVYVEISSSSSTCGSRRVIPRAGASLFLAVVGLVLVGIAVALRVDLNGDYVMKVLGGSFLPLITLPLMTVGSVAIAVSIAFAVTSLYPWNRRCSKYAIAALVLDGLPLLFFG